MDSLTRDERKLGTEDCEDLPDEASTDRFVLESSVIVDRTGRFHIVARHRFLHGQIHAEQPRLPLEQCAEPLT